MGLTYLDNHATTPLDPRVAREMAPYLADEFGNASSKHALGMRAAAAVERAREQLASLLGASPKEVVFTSGATESNNLVLKGIAEASRGQRDHIVTVRTEHKAILDACKYLEKTREQQLRMLRPLGLAPSALEGLEPQLAGARVTYLEVGRDGRIDLGRLREAISQRTCLVSVMLANNEIGVLQPIAEIGRLCREKGVPFHTDAAQGLGRVELDVKAAGVDFVSISGHKMYGPKGVGALYVRDGAKLPSCQIHGGGHERGVRSGTLNVAGVVGLGAAAELSGLELKSEAPRLLQLRERLTSRLEGSVEGIVFNGDLRHRLPGSLSLTVPLVDSEKVMEELPGTAISSGAACSSQSLETSHVLRAIGVGQEAARCTLRIGIGRFNTEEEVERFAQELLLAIERVRRRLSGMPRRPREEARDG